MNDSTLQRFYQNSNSNTSNHKNNVSISPHQQQQQQHQSSPSVPRHNNSNRNIEASDVESIAYERSDGSLQRSPSNNSPSPPPPAAPSTSTGTSNPLQAPPTSLRRAADDDDDDEADFDSPSRHLVERYPANNGCFNSTFTINDNEASVVAGAANNNKALTSPSSFFGKRRNSGEVSEISGLEVGDFLEREATIASGGGSVCLAPQAAPIQEVVVDLDHDVDQQLKAKEKTFTCC